MSRTLPWEANSYSASQGISCLLWKLKGLSLPLQKSAMGPYPKVQESSPHPPTSTLSSYQSTDIPSDVSLSGFLQLEFCTHFLSLPCMVHHKHLILLDLIMLIIYRYLLNSTNYEILNYAIFQHLPVTSSLLGSNILLSILLLNTFNLGLPIWPNTHPYNMKNTKHIQNSNEITQFLTFTTRCQKYFLMKPLNHVTEKRNDKEHKCLYSKKDSGFSKY